MPSGYPAHTLVDVTRPLYHWVELHRSRSMRSTRASIRTGDGLGAAARPHSGSVLKEETKKAPPPPPTLNFHPSCVLMWLNKDPSGSPRTQREEMHSERAGGGPSKRSLPERRKEGWMRPTSMMDEGPWKSAVAVMSTTSICQPLSMVLLLPLWVREWSTTHTRQAFGQDCPSPHPCLRHTFHSPLYG